MSGGVDSSVAAFLTKEQGFECVGCTMKLYDNDDAGVPREHSCCSLNDVEDARSVAYRLGMPYYVFNFKEDFEEKVINKFIRSYEAGITPNPCIDCNRYMKFDKLFERARIMNCDYVVTGHYARVEQDPSTGLYVLKKAVDPGKDQSYVLYSMTQEQLKHTMFPLGGFVKSETRAIAEEHGFVNARKPDSQDICFVPDGDYARIIELHTGRKSEPGNYVDLSGKVLGRHRGIINYTIGQHRWLGLDLPQAMYVQKLDTDKNEVVLGPESALFSRDADADDFNWISGAAPDGPFRCMAKVRYRHNPAAATVTPVEAAGGSSIHIEFDEPQRAITPGQAAVLYDGDLVLGGGVIRKNV